MKGKAYSDELKEQVLKEIEETGNVTIFARNHNIPSTTICTWIKRRKTAVNGSSSRRQKSSNFNSNSCNKEVEKDLEIAILKDL